MTWESQKENAFLKRKESHRSNEGLLKKKKFSRNAFQGVNLGEKQIVWTVDLINSRVCFSIPAGVKSQGSCCHTWAGAREGASRGPVKTDRGVQEGRDGLAVLSGCLQGRLWREGKCRAGSSCGLSTVPSFSFPRTFSTHGSAVWLATRSVFISRCVRLPDDKGEGQDSKGGSWGADGPSLGLAGWRGTPRVYSAGHQGDDSRAFTQSWLSGYTDLNASLFGNCFVLGWACLH